MEIDGTEVGPRRTSDMWEGYEVGKEVYNQGSKEKKWGQDPQDELQQPGQLDGLLRANAAGVED